MNFLDIVILILWLFFAIRGVSKGLVKEVFSLAGVIVGFVGAYIYIDRVMDFIGVSGTVMKILVFILIFVVLYFAVLLIGVIISKILKLIFLGFLNRLLGLVLGFLEGFVISSLIVYLLTLFSKGMDWVDSSTLGPFILKVLRNIGWHIHVKIPEGGPLTYHLVKNLPGIF